MGLFYVCEIYLRQTPPAPLLFRRRQPLCGTIPPRFQQAENALHPMLNIAVRAARAGGRVLTQSMHRLDTVRIEAKGKNDFVSEVDRATEAEILSTLQRSSPDHRYICEASGESGNY